MFWTTKGSPTPGDTRVIKKFAFFPIGIFNEETKLNEWKWFEYCTIKQKYFVSYDGTSSWENIEFLDGEQ